MLDWGEQYMEQIQVRKQQKMFHMTEPMRP
jgi:hypothetical protein